MLSRGADMTMQAPPNRHRREDLEALLHAGVNDWGGVSPVTPDHVNPEAPWPHLEMLAAATHVAGRMLSQRLAIGPSLARDVETWVDAGLATRVRRSIEVRGLSSEERLVGKECVSRFRSRWSPYHYKKKT